MKGQSAVEYLTTYTWMFIALSVVSAFAFNMVNMKCEDSIAGFYSNSLEINDVGVDIDNLLRVSFTNVNSYNVTINEIKLSLDDENTSKSFNKVLEQSSTKQVSLGGLQKSNKCEEIEMKIIFDKASLTNQTATATLKTAHQIS